MKDGHKGTRIVDIKKDVFCHNFILALTHLQDNRAACCVVHVHPRLTGVSHGLSQVDFLLMLGFRRYEGSCDALKRTCYFKRVRELDPRTVGSRLGLDDFDAFTANIHGWYERADKLARSIGDHSNFVRWGAQFSTEPKALDIQAKEPDWMEASRVEGHQDALDTLAKAQADEKRFRTVEACLYAGDAALENAVQYTLSDLGLDVQKTTEGEHVDLILEYPPKNLQIGIEVTGVKGSLGIKKAKSTQVQVYLEECDELDIPAKGVIIANILKGTAPSERGKRQQFTNTLVKAMKGSEVVGLTTVDLCRIWEDAQRGDCRIGEVIEDICDHSGGVYEYRR